MLTRRSEASILVRVTLAVMLLPDVTLLPWLTYHYEKICPIDRDERVGAVYPLNEHGNVVYLTLGQHRQILAGQTYLIGSVLCSFAIGIWTSLKPRAKNK